jgi:hypothetical protein
MTSDIRHSTDVRSLQTGSFVRRIVAYAVTGLGLAACSTVSAKGPPRRPAAVHQTGPHGNVSQVILHTTPDPLPCDRQVRNFNWTPTEDIRVMSIALWIGTTWTANEEAGKPLIDVWSTVLLPDGFVLVHLGLDRYGAPNGVHQIDKAFGDPQVLRVPAGTPITLQHQCSNYGATEPQSATNAIINWIGLTREAKP